MQQETGPLVAKVKLPGEKRLTLRALFLAMLADGVSELSGMRIDPVVRTMSKTLNQLGIVTQLDVPTRSCIIAGCNGKVPKKNTTVWCDRSKTIARYLLAACSGTTGVFYFDGNARLRHYSFLTLLNIIRLHGAQLIPGDVEHMPLTLIGADSLEGGNISFEDKISAQLISPLLMIAPYARSPFHFSIIDTIDTHYIDMTIALMAEFGVLVHRIPQGQFMVPVPQRYQARDYLIEPDLALGLYFFAAAAITGGEVSTQAIKRMQSKQRAVKYLSALERIGCTIAETHKSLTIKGPQTLYGLELNLREFSHAFVVFSVLAPFAKTKTRITHIGGISPREIKLMMAIRDEFMAQGINIETGDNWIDIHPGRFNAKAINARDNELLAMAFSLIALKNPIIRIENPPKQRHIFPEFYSIWNSILEQSHVSA